MAEKLFFTGLGLVMGMGNVFGGYRAFVFVGEILMLFGVISFWMKK